MEKLSLKLKLALGLLSALLIFFSFPPYEIPFLSVLGLAIYFMIISDFKSFKRGLFLSLYTGFFIGVLLFYWFYYPISEVYGLPTWIGFLAPIPAGILYSLFHFGIMYPILHLTYSITDNRFKALFLAPFIWTFLEVLREFTIFDGFPWNLMGYSISYINLLTQVTSILGIYILSFLVLYLAVVISWILIYYVEKYQINLFNIANIVGVTIMLIVIAAYGFNKMANYKPEGIKKRVALIQGNVDQKEKLNVSNYRKINNLYMDLINKALEGEKEGNTGDKKQTQKQDKNEKVDLIILPESSVYITPSYIEKEYMRFFANIKQVDDTLLLIGLDDITFSTEGDIKIYNSVYLFKTNGEIVDFYRKIKLVPFGEYTPKTLKWLSNYINYLGGIDFSRGAEKRILQFGDFKIVPLICFEAIFPYFVGEFAKRGNLIVNITNDAWFGNTAGPYQHFEMARVRAVENGKYLVRVANSGISAVIDPIGRIQNYIPLNVRAIVYADVYLIDEETVFEKYLLYVYALYIILPFAVFLLLLVTSNRDTDEEEEEFQGEEIFIDDEEGRKINLLDEIEKDKNKGES